MLMYELLQLNRPSAPEGDQGLMVSNSKVGVEIEIQTNSGAESFRDTAWSAVPEGSIRGFEIVLSRPLSGALLVEALDDAEEKINTLRGDNKFSEMTSTHVHIDIRDMEVDQLLNFLTLSIMFENVLYSYVAEHRSKNHFCLRTNDCTDVLERLDKLVKAKVAGNLTHRTFSELFSVESVKYAGINLSSIARYGSLEFRMHHGTGTANEIIRWVNILLSLKEYAMGEGRTPTNILDTKKELGISSIFSSALGSYSGILSYEEVEEDILNGIRNAQDFVSVLLVPQGRSVMTDIPNNPEHSVLHRQFSEWRDNHA